MSVDFLDPPLRTGRRQHMSVLPAFARRRIAMKPLALLATVGFFAVAMTAANAETVQYFPVPEGAGPHDVAPAPDGAVWYTAQGQGALGRLDPKSGEVKQVPLGEGSAPHGVIVGPDGAAWVTD